MQSFSGISLELVTVLQALIVIFIAAPALVKAIFRLRAARAARLRHLAWRRAGDADVDGDGGRRCRGRRAAAGFWTRQRRKVGVGAGRRSALVAAVLFGALATVETARFTLSEDAGGAALAINGTVGAILFGLIVRRAPARPCWPAWPGAGSAWLLGVGIVGVRAVVPVLADLRRADGRTSCRWSTPCAARSCSPCR